MSDEDILREFFVEYNHLWDTKDVYDGKITVNQFYEKYGINFLRLFFNMKSMDEVWQKFPEFNRYRLADLVGSNLYLLENLDDPVAGEIANNYLDSIDLFFEDGTLSGVINYIKPALELLLKFDLSDTAKTHINRFFGGPLQFRGSFPRIKNKELARQFLHRHIPRIKNNELPRQFRYQLIRDWIMLSIEIDDIVAAKTRDEHKETGRLKSEVDVSDNDILRQFLEEYGKDQFRKEYSSGYRVTQVSSEPHPEYPPGKNITETLSKHYSPPRQVQLPPPPEPSETVERFYTKYSTRFLKIFFNKKLMVKIVFEPEECDDDNEYYDSFIPSLMGEHLYLLENLNDPVAGEIADKYLANMRIVDDDSENATGDIYYVTRALKILLKNGLKEAAANHVHRFFRSLYDHHDYTFRYARETVGEKAGEWIEILTQIDDVEAVDSYFHLLHLYHTDELYGRGDGSYSSYGESRYVYSILDALVSAGQEYIDRSIEYENKSLKWVDRKYIYDLLADRKHPATLEYFFSFWGTSHCLEENGLGKNVLAVKGFDLSPSKILDLFNPSRPNLFKGVLCYFMGFDDAEVLKFLESFSDNSIISTKFVDAISYILTNPSERIPRVGDVADQAGRFLQLSIDDITSNLNIIQSNLKDKDWKRRVAIILIVIRFCQDLPLQTLKKYNLVWLIEEINEELCNGSSSQNVSEEEILEFLSHSIYDLLFESDRLFLEEGRSFVTNPQKLQGFDRADNKGGNQQ
ncbi:MAG: hypothetical protein RTV72_11640 [Candidatus Thorarchaeota archaeon]